MQRADNRPPYARIAAHYREKIVSGELPAGVLLPSIKTLSSEWGVATATVEKALRTLREEQLVRGIHGVGTEVVGTPIPLSSGAQRHDRGLSTGSSWGTGERSDSHEGAVVPAPSDVAAAMGIGVGEKVIRRSRVYRDGHGVVAHSTSWIPAEYAQAVPALVRSERIKGGTSLGLIARSTGRHAVRRRDETAARIATADDLRLLELPPDTTAAVLVLHSKFVDAQGRLIEYGVDVGAPGRTRKDVSEISS